MKNGKIGYAVAGLGVGMSHVGAAAANNKATLLAVCDLNEDKLSKVKAKYPDVTTYTVFDEMMKNPDIDIVSIALPSGLHAEYAVKALEAGKNVLCEKPIDVTVEKALTIEEARVRTGKKVGVIFQNRNNACMKPFKKAIEDGRLGKIFLGTFAVKWARDQAYYDSNGGWRGTWKMDGGGSLMNQAVHTVDLMQWLMGDVASVSSTISVYNHNIETEDLSASVIKFKNGATATFVSTTDIYPGLGTDIQVYGTNGSIEVDGDTIKTWKIKDAAPDEEAKMLELYGHGNSSAVTNDPTLVTGHTSQVNDIIDAVLEDRDPQVLPLEAIKAVRIITSVYESAKTGKTVYFN
jgi:predicted dehydrogenase